MTSYQQLITRLPTQPKTWLITGVAGFIGCNLLETLLRLEQNVVGLDNFATGHRHNLKQIQGAVTQEQWARFKFIEGDIRTLDDCRAACAGVDYVLHQAALGSVPRSLEDPITTNTANIDGFLNMLVAARDAALPASERRQTQLLRLPRQRRAPLVRRHQQGENPARLRTQPPHQGGLDGSDGLVRQRFECPG